MKLHHMKGIGLSNVYLRNGFTIENSDGDETISYENLTGLYLEIGRAIASTPFTLRAEEYAQATTHVTSEHSSHI
ncbi:MAG: hypothetical protein RL420_1640 [Pseudomonadota bacterium]